MPYNLLTNPEADGVGRLVPGAPHWQRQGFPHDARLVPPEPARSERQRSDRVLDLARRGALAAQSLLNGEVRHGARGRRDDRDAAPRRLRVQGGEILSPDGHCRAFDADSKGTVFGSGVGVVVLRRLADALADGDHIHAVIRGSAVNNDGSTKVGYLAPSVDGQAAAIAEALGDRRSRCRAR